MARRYVKSVHGLVRLGSAARRFMISWSVYGRPEPSQSVKFTQAVRSERKNKFCKSEFCVHGVLEIIISGVPQRARR